jgi:hypothetical protein
VVGIVAIVCLFAATNDWGAIGTEAQLERDGDAAFYSQIAAAAPGLPDGEVGSAYAERFAFPWAAGTASDLFGFETSTPFWILTAAVALLAVCALTDICRRLGLPAPGTLLCVGLFVLNPYVLRPYTLSPVSTDLAFVGGLAILLWGLVTCGLAIVVAAAFVSALGRQTALLVGPAAVPWLLWGAGWRDRDRRRRLLAVGLTVAAPLVAYALIKLAISSFSEPFAPSIPGDTVVPVIGDSLGVSELGAHLARVIAPLVVCAACIAGVLVGLAMRGERYAPPAEFWCALTIAAAVIAQPLLISPDFPGFEHNEERLAALGVLPLCVSLAYLFRSAERSLRAIPTSALVIGALALAAASLHDTFTVVGPGNNGQFIALELVAAAVLAVTLAVVVADPRRRRIAA